MCDDAGRTSISTTTTTPGSIYQFPNPSSFSSAPARKPPHRKAHARTNSIERSIHTLEGYRSQEGAFPWLWWEVDRSGLLNRKVGPGRAKKDPPRRGEGFGERKTPLQLSPVRGLRLAFPFCFRCSVPLPWRHRGLHLETIGETPGAAGIDRYGIAWHP